MAALTAPFKSKDMNVLYKKVTSANYKPLPQRYSPELREIISMMLQPNPNLRPTCNQLLQLPALIATVRQLSQFDQNITSSLQSTFVMGNTRLTHSVSQGSLQDSIYNRCTIQTGALLETIKLPRMLRQLTNILPKSNYADKSRFQQLGQSLVQKPKMQLNQSQVASKGFSLPPNYPVPAFKTPQKSLSKFAANEVLNPTQLVRNQDYFYTEEKPQFKNSEYSANKVNSYGSSPQQRAATNKADELLAMAMLNPPMALFHKQDQAIYRQIKPLLVYPDFLQNNSQGAGGVIGAGQVPELIHMSPPANLHKRSNKLSPQLDKENVDNRKEYSRYEKIEDEIFINPTQRQNSNGPTDDYRKNQNVQIVAPQNRQQFVSHYKISSTKLTPPTEDSSENEYTQLEQVKGIVRQKSRIISLHTQNESPEIGVSQSVVISKNKPDYELIQRNQRDMAVKAVRNLVERVERKLQVISKSRIVFADKNFENDAVKRVQIDQIRDQVKRELTKLPSKEVLALQYRNKRTNSMDVQSNLQNIHKNTEQSESPLKQRGLPIGLNEIRQKRLSKPLR